MNTLVEKIINQIFYFDAGLKHQLQAFAGKSLQISIDNITTVTIEIENSGAFKMLSKDATVDLSVSGKLFSFLSYVKSGFNGNLGQYDISIDGDMEFARGLMLELKHSQIDWALFLSRFMPEPIALGFKEFASQFKSSLMSRTQNTQLAIERFLTAELKCLPSKKQFQDFEYDVYHLQLAADRVEQKLQLLQNKKIIIKAPNGN